MERAWNVMCIVCPQDSTPQAAPPPNNVSPDTERDNALTEHVDTYSAPPPAPPTTEFGNTPVVASPFQAPRRLDSSANVGKHRGSEKVMYARTTGGKVSASDVPSQLTVSSALGPTRGVERKWTTVSSNQFNREDGMRWTRARRAYPLRGPISTRMQRGGR
jgi:hypothetical protein